MREPLCASVCFQELMLDQYDKNLKKTSDKEIETTKLKRRAEKLEKKTEDRRGSETKKRPELPRAI